jgi:hypothetical protein
MKKLVMVDCLTQHRIRFAVEVEDNIDHALDEVVVREGDMEFIEFSQKHLGLTVFSHREITKEDYLRMFDEDNDYLKGWSEENKLNWINKIDYKETE